MTLAGLGGCICFPVGMDDGIIGVANINYSPNERDELARLVNTPRHIESVHGLLRPFLVLLGRMDRLRRDTGRGRAKTPVVPTQKGETGGAT